MKSQLVATFAMIGLAASCARADLFIQELKITAAALADTERVEHENMTLDPPSMLTATAEPSPNLRGFGMQTQNGFFQNYASFPAASGVHDAEAFTTFHLVVGTDTADAPLVLDFNFLGAQLIGSAYYSAGQVRLQVEQSIKANGSNVWQAGGAVNLNPGGFLGWFAPTVTTYDVQGIGLPVRELTSGYEGFADRMILELLPFHGTLDFGLLQPGEFFTLDYRAYANAEGYLNSPGSQASAVAFLVDPFSLGGEPPPQLSLRGLTLPGPVPEPSAVLLALTGSAWLSGRRRYARDLR